MFLSQRGKLWRQKNFFYCLNELKVKKIGVYSPKNIQNFLLTMALCVVTFIINSILRNDEQILPSQLVKETKLCFYRSSYCHVRSHISVNFINCFVHDTCKF